MNEFDTGMGTTPSMWQMHGTATIVLDMIEES